MSSEWTPELWAQAVDHTFYHHECDSRIAQLEAALARAEAEVAEMRHACQNLLGCPAPMWRERAERAEAEVSRLHDTSAALARFQALEPMWICPRTGDDCGDRQCMSEYYAAEDVRAAIEGSD